LRALICELYRTIEVDALPQVRGVHRSPEKQEHEQSLGDSLQPFVIPTESSDGLHVCFLVPVNSRMRF